MKFLLDFEFPLYLWGLWILPLVVLLGIYMLYQLEGGRRFASVVCRVCILILVVLAVSGLVLVSYERREAVVYLVDVSYSVTGGEGLEGVVWEEVLDRIGRIRRELGSASLEAVVLFGGEPYLLRGWGSGRDLGLTRRELEEGSRLVDRERSDLEGALRFCGSLFPLGYRRRIYLFTDGRETVGDGYRQARFLASEGVVLEVDSISPPVERGVDVRLLALELSQTQARLGEAVRGWVKIYSSHCFLKRVLPLDLYRKLWGVEKLDRGLVEALARHRVILSTGAILSRIGEILRIRDGGREYFLRREGGSGVVYPAMLTFYRNGFVLRRILLELKKGLNEGEGLSFRDNLEEKGLSVYQASLEGVFLFGGGKGGSGLKGWRHRYFAQGAVYVYSGRLKVLLVEEDQDSALPLMEALEKEHIQVKYFPPNALTPSMFSDFDLVIFSDVRAGRLKNDYNFYTPTEIMNGVRDYVRRGGGFLMIGGPNSFGLGDYKGTPLEKILPVELEVPKAVELPSVAIVLVIDKSGSMASQNKIELAKEACIKLVELLQSKDWVGLVAFDSFYRWIVDLQQVVDKIQIISDIRQIGASGGTDIYPALREAFYKLRDNQHARIKHIILLSDGRTRPNDFTSLCKRIAAHNITISCVSVGRGADRSLMRRIARLGQGRHYFTNNFNNIPRIFTQEALKISRSSIVDEPFRPVVGTYMDYLDGIDFDSAPYLLSFVSTYAKKDAIVSLLAPGGEEVEGLGRPLLATWRVGLGRSGAFTSDAKNRWASQWIRWRYFPKFWGQLVRYLARKKVQGDYRLRVELGRGEARVLLEAVDRDLRFMNLVRPGYMLRLRKVGDLGGRDLPFRQVGPGSYELVLGRLERGIYMGILHQRGDTRELQSVVFQVLPTKEYLYWGEDWRLLDRLRFPLRLVEVGYREGGEGDLLARLGRLWGKVKLEWRERGIGRVWLDGELVGRVELEGDRWVVYGRGEGSGDLLERRVPLWPYLLLFALLLLPVDIAIRKIRWGGGERFRLKMRPLEVGIRSLAALVGLVLGMWLGYGLGESFGWSGVRLGVGGVELSLDGILVGFWGMWLGGWLGWRYVLRGRMF